MVVIIIKIMWCNPLGSELADGGMLGEDRTDTGEYIYFFNYARENSCSIGAGQGRRGEHGEQHHHEYRTGRETHVR